MMRRALLWRALAPAVALLCVACGGGRKSGEVRNQLRISIAGDPQSFDPLQVIDDSSDTVRYLTAGVLVRVNRATDALEPELAESWKMSDDGRTISFHLRSGLKFSDNTPLNANDVARTLRRALDPKEASPFRDKFAGNPAITVSSPLNITIAYPGPKPGLDRLFDTLPIVPAKMAKLPASSGPFYYSDYRPGQYVMLSRNPNYWKRDSSGKQLPYLDSVRVAIQGNHDVEVEKFLRGEQDIVAKLEPAAFDRVEKARPGSAHSLGPSLNSESMWFNESPRGSLPEWKRKWFQSASFRHAVSLAINREDIARVVYDGRAHPSAGPVSPANKFWFNASLKPLPYDETAAMKALTKEGFTQQTGGLRDAAGHPVEFSLITNGGNLAREHMAPLIQSDLAKLGIKVNVVTLDFNSLLDRLTKSFNYEAVLLSLNIEADPIEVMNLWLSSGDHHAWYLSEKTPATPWEARIDELERIQATSGSREVRKKAFDEVQKIAVEEEPIIYLVNPDALCAIAPNLKGAQPSVAPPSVWWNVEWLRFE
ncbi:MAG TPA: ABC transporter substrate-binding protein [Bryobacteraceae bacterium]|nr:ABC transporter substrate-binding protein [Bryobacteraceae bacterium]